MKARTVNSEGDGSVPVIIVGEATVESQGRDPFQSVSELIDQSGWFGFLPDVASWKISLALEKLEVPLDGRRGLSRHNARQIVMPPRAHGEGGSVLDIPVIVGLDVH